MQDTGRSGPAFPCSVCTFGLSSFAARHLELTDRGHEGRGWLPESNNIDGLPCNITLEHEYYQLQVLLQAFMYKCMIIYERCA